MLFGRDEGARTARSGAGKHLRLTFFYPPLFCVAVCLIDGDLQEEAKALEERKRKASSTNAELPGADGKKRWSHRDPSTGMTEGVIEQKVRCIY